MSISRQANTPHISTKSLPSASINGRDYKFDTELVELGGFEPQTF
jgi:hypothetical protein